MDLIILGGSTNQLGGIEAFCERSVAALRRRDSSWQVHHLATETAYLRIRRLPVMLGQVGLLVRRWRRKPDVVWVQYGNLPDLAFVLLAKLLGMRVMMTPHLGANWRSQRSAILRWLSRSLVGLADRIALLSDTQRTEIALPPGRPMTVICSVLPEYILDAAPAPDATGNQLRLVHAARLSASKGTFLVIEVARRLRDAGVPFRLEIAGSGDADTLARLDALIGGYDLAEHVVLKGRLEGPALLATLNEADVLVHLSQIDSYPLILLEAMACSALPVAIDLAGARNMIATFDGAIVGEADAVEETVRWLVASDLADLRSRGKALAARVREAYSSERFGNVIAEALLECAETPDLRTAPKPARPAR